MARSVAPRAGSVAAVYERQWSRDTRALSASTLGSDGPALRVARRPPPGLPQCRFSRRAQYHGGIDGSRNSHPAADASRICRSFALLAQLVEHFHGKEGVAGSSPAEGFRNRATARFSRFRSGSGDHFRALPSEKGSSMAPGRRCAAVRATAERVLLQVQGTDAVHGERDLCRDRRANRRRSVRRGPPPAAPASRRSRLTRVRDGRVVAVGSSGPRAIATAARALSQQAEQQCRYRCATVACARSAGATEPARSTSSATCFTAPAHAWVLAYRRHVGEAFLSWEGETLIEPERNSRTRSTTRLVGEGCRRESGEAVAVGCSGSW